MRRAGWPGLTRALKEAVAADSRAPAPSPIPRPRLVAISNSLQPTGLRGPSPSPPKPGLHAWDPFPSSLFLLPDPPPRPVPSSLPHPQLSVRPPASLEFSEEPSTRRGQTWGGLGRDGGLPPLPLPSSHPTRNPLSKSGLGFGSVGGARWKEEKFLGGGEGELVV